MGKFDGFLLLTDMDGTFYDNRGNVSEETAKALEYFKDNGGLFTISTGRPHHDVVRYLKYVNTNYIGLNGTAIYDYMNGDILYSDKIDPAGIEIFEQIFRDTNKIDSIHIYFDKDTCGISKEDLSKDSDIISKRRGGRLWCKAIWVGDAETILSVEKMLIETYGNRYNFNRSWPNGLEMHSKTSGKGELIPKLIELSGKNVHTTVAVGDFENDMSMIKCATIGYAVGNALDSVKAVADRITVTNNESALAKIIYELDKEY